MTGNPVLKTAQINEALLSAIQKADSILLIAHVSPDGDTVGSTLALRLAFTKLGKRVTVACADPAPGLLSFLNGFELIAAAQEVEGKSFDLALAVDVSDERRMGELWGAFSKAADTCQIDHHGTNPAFARVNVIDPKASATGILAYQLIERLNVPMDAQMARCLYAAISTDTGNFSFDNTTGQAFYVMSRLMAYDLPVNELNRVLFRQRSQAQVRLLSRALDSLAFYAGGRIAGMMITKKDFEECGALPEHAEAIVNFGIDTVGVEMAFLCRETPDGKVKFSLRALPPWNVADIAAQYQGGGHNLAAGCTLSSPIQEAAGHIAGAMLKQLNDGPKKARE